MTTASNAHNTYKLQFCGNNHLLGEVDINRKASMKHFGLKTIEIIFHEINHNLTQNSNEINNDLNINQLYLIYSFLRCFSYETHKRKVQT